MIIMNLQDELAKLGAIMDDARKGEGAQDADFLKQLELIQMQFTSAQDVQTIADFLLNRMETVKEEAVSLQQEMNIRQQMEDVCDIISVSYIAKHYFGKTKSWLYQRMNGNVVNGKVCAFSQAEIDRLNFALKDISQKIGSLNIAY